MEHTLPIFHNDTSFDKTLSSPPQTLKEYISQYKQKKEIFDLKERHDINEIDIESPIKNFFTNNFICRHIHIYNSYNFDYNYTDNIICAVQSQ